MITIQELKEYANYCIMAFVSKQGYIVDDLDDFIFKYMYIYPENSNQFEIYHWEFDNIEIPTFDDLCQAIDTHEYKYFYDIHQALMKLKGNNLVFGNTDFQNNLKQYFKDTTNGEYFNTDTKRKFVIYNGEYF
jgi:hypothetical protein